MIRNIILKSNRLVGSYQKFLSRKYPVTRKIVYNETPIVQSLKLGLFISCSLVSTGEDKSNNFLGLWKSQSLVFTGEDKLELIVFFDR